MAGYFSYEKLIKILIENYYKVIVEERERKIK
jgi:hypothetical protein